MKGYTDAEIAVIGRIIITIGVTALLFGNVFLLGHELKKV
jgi:hypothetical protein